MKMLDKESRSNWSATRAGTRIVGGAISARLERGGQKRAVNKGFEVGKISLARAKLG